MGLSGGFLLDDDADDVEGLEYFTWFDNITPGLLEEMNIIKKFEKKKNIWDSKTHIFTRCFKKFGVQHLKMYVFNLTPSVIIQDF